MDVEPAGRGERQQGSLGGWGWGGTRQEHVGYCGALGWCGIRSFSGAPARRTLRQAGKSASLGSRARMIPRCVYCPFLHSGTRVGMWDLEVLVLSVLSPPFLWLLPVWYLHHPAPFTWTIRPFLRTLHAALL